MTTWMPQAGILHRRPSAGLHGPSLASFEGDTIQRAEILGQKEIGI